MLRNFRRTISQTNSLLSRLASTEVTADKLAAKKYQNSRQKVSAKVVESIPSWWRFNRVKENFTKFTSTNFRSERQTSSIPGNGMGFAASSQIVRFWASLRVTVINKSVCIKAFVPTLKCCFRKFLKSKTSTVRINQKIIYLSSTLFNSLRYFLRYLFSTVSCQ